MDGRAAPDRVAWTHVACALCGADRPRLLVVDRVVRGGDRFDFPVVRCRECGFVYVTPRGVGEALGNTSGGGAWRGAAVANAPIYRAGVRRLMDAGLAAGGRVLDIGCGYGDFLAFARDRGLRAAGVEIHPALAEAARTRGFDVHRGDLRQLTLPSTFDALTLWDVIEHVDDPVGLLRACCAAVRPAGLVLFHTGNARFQIPKARLLSALRPGGGPYLAPHQHLSHFDPRTARRAVREAGLAPLAVFHAGTLRYPQPRKRLAMRAWNRVLSCPARLGGPLLTSAMAVLAVRPPT